MTSQITAAEETNCCIDAAEKDLCRSPQNHTQSIDMQLRPPFLRIRSVERLKPRFLANGTQNFR